MNGRRNVNTLAMGCLVLALASAWTPATAEMLYVDFGRSDGVNGNQTLSPDVNGNTWNNVSSATQGGAANLTVNNLVTISNTATTIDISTSAGWQTNGRLNGGLFSPNGPQASLLGDFAIETATEDYFFLDGVNGTITLSQLDPTKLYNLSFFATRVQPNPAGNPGDTRSTTYTVGSSSVTLQTTGQNIGSNGIYDGNDDEIVSLSNLSPDVNNQLVISVTRSGQFGYIGVLGIQVVPEPGTLAMLAIGGIAVVAARRFRRS